MQQGSNPRNLSFQESLGANVIETGRCLGCGACVLVCPLGCLDYESGHPKLSKECKTCGICARICSSYEWSLPQLEKFAFGRERLPEEEFGVYRRLVVARAKEEAILNVSQDGGVVTTLLLYALENKLIEGAIVSGTDERKPFFPVPKLATTRQEVMNSAGTKYFYSPNLLALSESVRQKKANIAFVGTPCQIRAVRKLQVAGLKKYVDSVRFSIGLLCSESFTYEGLMGQHIRGTMGLDPERIRKMNIKGKVLVSTDSGMETITLQEAKQHARNECKACADFSSELADISVGGLGLDRWTFTIVRSEKGEDLFLKAQEAGVIEVRDIKEEPNALNLLRKLSSKKRQNSALPKRIEEKYP